MESVDFYRSQSFLISLIYNSRVFYIKFLVNPQCLPAPSNFSFTWVMIFSRERKELLIKTFRVKILKLFKFVPNRLLTSPQFLKIGFIEVKFIYSKSYPYTVNLIPYMRFDKHIQLSTTTIKAQIAFITLKTCLVALFSQLLLPPQTPATTDLFKCLYNVDFSRMSYE